MIEKRDRVPLKRAFEKSLDLLGDPSKKSLLRYLETQFQISFAENRSPQLEEIESALRFIFGQGANIITDELHKNLAQPERSQRKKSFGTRQGKSSRMNGNSLIS